MPPGPSNYSFVQLESLWIQAGGAIAWAPLMAAVALAESEGSPNALNSTDPYGGSFGLWQINGSHAPGGHSSGLGTDPWVQSMYTPLQNAQAAVAVFNSQGLGAWKGDSAIQHFGVITSPPSLQTVVAWVATQGYTASTLAGATGTPPGSVPGQGQMQTLDPSAAGAATPGLGITYPWSGVIGDVEKLFNVSFWKRILMGALGVGMIGAGLWIFLGTTQAGEKAESEVTKAGMAAALA